MANNKVCVVITSGLSDERSSVAWSMANGALDQGLEVSVFLASSAIDWVRKGAADNTHLNPLDPPMKDMIGKVLEHGCAIGACPPCAKSRGYSEEICSMGSKLLAQSSFGIESKKEHKY